VALFGINRSSPLVTLNDCIHMLYSTEYKIPVLVYESILFRSPQQPSQQAGRDFARIVAEERWSTGYLSVVSE
jgi:hypothetical protein